MKDKELRALVESALTVAAEKNLEKLVGDDTACAAALETIEKARRALRLVAIKLSAAKDTHTRDAELDAIAAKLGPEGLKRALERAQRVEAAQVTTDTAPRG